MNRDPDATARRILAAAEAWIGTPYRHQGARKGIGCDCLGLVRGVWREVYGSEAEAPEPYAADWCEADAADRLLDAARRHCKEKAAADAGAGDLLLFRWRDRLPARHAGILGDGGRFIHAYQGTAVVASVLVPAWRRRIAAAFAFPDLPPT